MTLGSAHVSSISAVAGGVFAVLSFMFLKRPEAFERGLKGFPRNRLLGILLTAAALVWSSIMINQMTLGELSKYKNLLYFLTPLTFYFVVRYLDELLAARALGGLLMLTPVIMVDTARWHPSSWRLAVVILAYVMVIAGAWLMLCPFKFRIWAAAATADSGRSRLSGIVALVIAVLLFAAAWFTR